MIIVDIREKVLIDCFKLMDVNVAVRKLEKHDFEICGKDFNIIGEIKRYKDMYLSLIDGRLQEAMHLGKSGLIIYEFSHSNKCIEKEIMGIFARNYVNFLHDYPSIPILPSCCPQNTARLLLYIDNKIGDPRVILRPIKKRKDDFMLNVYEFLLSLPGVGRVTAKKIVDNYSTLMDFIKDMNNWHKVIGENKAKKIIEFLSKSIK